MRTTTSVNANNALLGFLVILVPFLGLPSWFKTVILAIIGFLIIIFALASSNFGQHDGGGTEKH